jgi:hypothetical protein
VVTVGQHGLVYIDDATHDVRRFTNIADGVPQDFPVRASTVAVDYEYVSINGHDYFVPVHGEFRLGLGKRAAVLQLIQFNDYRRFGSRATIVSDTH